MPNWRERREARKLANKTRKVPFNWDDDNKQNNSNKFVGVKFS